MSKTRLSENKIGYKYMIFTTNLCEPIEAFKKLSIQG